MALNRRQLFAVFAGGGLARQVKATPRPKALLVTAEYQCTTCNEYVYWLDHSWPATTKPQRAKCSCGEHLLKRWHDAGSADDE